MLRLAHVGLVPALLVVGVMGGLTFVALSSIAGPEAHDAKVVPLAPAKIVNAATVVVTPKPHRTAAPQIATPKKAHPAASTQSNVQAPSASRPTTTRVSPQVAGEIGQMVISSVTGSVADAGLLARVHAGHVGGIILSSENIRTPAQIKSLVASLQHAALTGRHPGLLVMTDQEGGTVKRFASLPPATSAQVMATMSASSIFAQGQATGTGLRSYGVNVDLAPVSDVPVSSGTFLGSRAFGRDATLVARDVCAFSGGLHQGGVVSTLKHFPGLGKAVGNTDDQIVTIAAGQPQLAPDLRPYRSCAKGQKTMVMVSNAVYTGLTGGLPAVASPATYTLLRRSVGFYGPVISDSLDARAVAGIPDVAVASASAGLDLELWTSEASAAVGYRQLVAAVESGRLSAGRVRVAALKIRALKASMSPGP